LIYWHYDTGVVLDGNSLRGMLQVMVTQSEDRSQYSRSRERYTQVHRNKATYTRRLDIPKSRMCIHALSHKEKRVHVGKLNFGPVVFRPMVLVLGIASQVLNPSIGSLVLFLHGFGPWY